MSHGSQTRRYLPEVDGLRAIAVLSVILFHLDVGMTGGFVGVDVFFVISGFLISTILFKELASGQFSLIEFYLRRVRRIAPALIAMILGTLVAAWFIVLPDDFARFGSALISQPLMLANVYHWRNTGYFLPNAERFPLLHTWTLAVEEQFYLFFPIFLVWIHRRFREQLWLVVVALLLGSLSASIWVTYSLPHAAFFLLPFRVWELMLGTVVSMMVSTQRRKPSHTRPSKYFELGSIFGLGAIAVSVYSFRSDLPFPGYLALCPCVGTALLIGCNCNRLTRSGKLLTWYPLVFTGQISYSLYLVHWPIIALYRYWHWDETGWLQKPLILGSVFLLGTLSYSCIETPFRKKWFLGERNSFLRFAICAPFLVLIAGVVVRMNKGFESRFDPLVLEFLSARNDIQEYQWVTPQNVLKRQMPEFGDTDGSLKVMLWGDSHAFVLIPVVDTICHEAGLKGVQVTYSRTLPLLGFQSTGELSLKERSIAYSQSVVDAAVELEIELVILSSYWSYYPFDSKVDACIETTIRALLEKGMRVLIIRDVAKMEHDVPMELARALQTGGDTAHIGVNHATHQQLNHSYDQAFQRIAAKHLGQVHVLDPASVFVDEKGLWRAELNGVAMYADDNHLSISGSKRLKPLIEASFRKLLPSDAADSR